MIDTFTLSSQLRNFGRHAAVRSSSPQVWLCSVGVNEGSPQASRPFRSGRACMHIPPILPYIGHRNVALTECFEKASRIRSRVSCALSCCCCCVTLGNRLISVAVVVESRSDTVVFHSSLCSRPLLQSCSSWPRRGDAEGARGRLLPPS